MCILNKKQNVKSYKSSERVSVVCFGSIKITDACHRQTYLMSCYFLTFGLWCLGEEGIGDILSDPFTSFVPFWGLRLEAKDSRSGLTDRILIFCRFFHFPFEGTYFLSEYMRADSIREEEVSVFGLGPYWHIRFLFLS